ncbi:Mu transposase domain-containing protein [Phaeobacter marinintestinus]|uniref:Mu transposase domain-containing protein n=1 Tax=Falsiphaeobacter marinintestinus TaxID=1492905 RepID=UPI0016459562|nr:hypothetical protein [Phaeobacter marinintestinus]
MLIRREHSGQKVGALPAVLYDACEKISPRATSISMVRYRGNDYSMTVAYAYREIHVRGYVGEIVIGCCAEVVARHLRSYEKVDMIFDPIQFLPLLEQKVGSLDQSVPLRDWDLPNRHRLLDARMGKRANGSTSRSLGCLRPSVWITSSAPCAGPLI